MTLTLFSPRRIVAALLLAMAPALPVGRPVLAGEDRVVTLRPGDDVAAAAARAPAGATIVLEAGVYYGHDIVPKDRQSFLGRGDARLRGSVPISGFRPVGGVWVADGPPVVALSAGACEATAIPVSACLAREDLFLGATRLALATAAADLAPGQWFHDAASGAVILGADPKRQPVEVTHEETAFAGAAVNVTLDGLTVERYASRAQHGAIAGGEGKGWVIAGSTVRDNTGAGIRTGNAMRVVESRILANGQIGVTGAGDGVVVARNLIAGNNTHGYRIAWEAGATKFVLTHNLSVLDNCLDDNDGAGVWIDIDNQDATVAGNVVVGSSMVGIFFEISSGAVISDNLVALGGRREASPWGAQILVSGSTDALVTGNTAIVADGFGNGVYVVEEGRANTSRRIHQHPLYDSTGDVVIGNRLLFLGGWGASGFLGHDLPGADLAARNRFADNRIMLAVPRAFFDLSAGLQELATAQQAGQELGSRVEPPSTLALAPALARAGCPAEVGATLRGALKAARIGTD